MSKNDPEPTVKVANSFELCHLITLTYFSHILFNPGSIQIKIINYMAKFNIYF
jgi:hypothetical protein